MRKVSGNECEVVKECVGHVQKRMGTELRKFKDLGRTKLTDGKTGWDGKAD